MIDHGTPLTIGSLLFEGIDQIDLTGPFEVFGRLPNATVRLYGKTLAPVRDVRGLRLTPDATLAEAPQLDVLHVPGGAGQEDVMHDEAVLSWLRRQAGGAKVVFFRVHRGSHPRGRRSAQGQAGDDLLERVPPAPFLRGHSGGRAGRQ